jgi:OOP family OmpA-OmpF porin
LPDVLFNTGSAALTIQAQSVLDTIALVLQQNPDWQIDIDDHTDNTGDSIANIRLSELRATTMAQALVVGGIAPARLRARRWGRVLYLWHLTVAVRGGSATGE